MADPSLRTGKIEYVRAIRDDLWIRLLPEAVPPPPTGFYRLNNPKPTMAALVFLAAVNKLTVTIRVSRMVDNDPASELEIGRVDVSGIL
jgi:hypothetical protein